MSQPNSFRPVFLTGMPGSGKTYWSRRLAQQYGLSLLDMDDLLEQDSGMSPPEYFERFGETAFREAERTLLHRILQQDLHNTIIACGGGTPCFYDNLQKMKRAGLVVLMRVPEARLVAHLEKEQHLRPLLRDVDLRSRLRDLWEQRQGFYLQADHIVSANILTIADFEPVFSAARL